MGTLEAEDREMTVAWPEHVVHKEGTLSVVVVIVAQFAIQGSNGVYRLTLE